MTYRPPAARPRLHLLAATALLPTLAGLTGCASNPGNAASTADSVNVLRSTVGETRTNLQQLNATLLEADRPHTLDGPAWFNTFKDRHATLRNRAKDLRKQTDAYAENRQAYLDRWSEDLAEIRDPRLREASTNRRERLRADLRTAGDQLEAANRELEPLLRELRDLQNFLVNDLTPHAFEQTRPQMVDAYEQADALIERSGDILQQLNKLIGEITYGGGDA